jgi:hypothetical protein
MPEQPGSGRQGGQGEEAVPSGEGVQNKDNENVGRICLRSSRLGVVQLAQVVPL